MANVNLVAHGNSVPHVPTLKLFQSMVFVMNVHILAPHVLLLLPVLLVSVDSV